MKNFGLQLKLLYSLFIVSSPEILYMQNKDYHQILNWLRSTNIQMLTDDPFYRTRKSLYIKVQVKPLKINLKSQINFLKINLLKNIF